MFFNFMNIKAIRTVYETELIAFLLSDFRLLFYGAVYLPAGIQR